MNKSIVRIVPAAVALAFACVGASAIAQTTTQKVEGDATKAWDATKNTSKKAWNGTKHYTHKAVKGTEKAADATGNAIDKGATKAADATRDVGDKIGSKIPGTAQNEAAKKP